MDITPLIKEGAQIIQSYAANQFRISGEIYTNPVIVLSEETRDWNVKDFETLTEQSFEPLINGVDQLDAILFGTGQTMKFLPPELKKALRKQGLNIETMDTGAACRTFNVLNAEGRQIAAALM